MLLLLSDLILLLSKGKLCSRTPDVGIKCTTALLIGLCICAQVLGKRLGGRMKDIADAVTKMGPEQIAEYEATGSTQVEYKAKGSGAVERETLQAGELQASH